jgi:RNA polymerase sigma factor (sigma-70 family)
MPANGQLRAVMRHLRRAVSATGLSDTQLLVRFLASRDEAAFELLVRRHEKMVHGLLQRVLRDAHAIDDAFQATFLTFARKASGIASGASLAPWLHRVALRTALRARLRASLRSRREQPVENLPETETPHVVLEDVSWRELRPVLDEELNALPEKYRTPLILCYLEGKTYKAIAEELGSTLGTVSTHITRARALLRTRLAKRGVELSAVLLAALLGKATVSAAGAALIEATVQSAIAFAAGSTTAVAIPAEVITLAQGVIKTMFIAKLKTAASVITGIACTGLLAGALVHGFAVAQPGAGDGGGFNPFGQQPAQQSVAETSWREVRRLEARGPVGEQVPVFSLAVSPDGKLLTAGTGAKTVKLWDIATGKDLATVDTQGGTVWDVRFSPDGRMLFSVGDDKAIRLWNVTYDGRGLNVRDTEVIARLESPIHSLAFSPDGARVAAGGPDTNLRVWDVRTGKPVGVFAQQGVSSAVFSPDGKNVLSAAKDGSVRLWDASTGKEVRREQGHQGPTHAVFTPDGKRIASAGHEGSVRLWDVASGKVLFLYQTDQALSTLAVSPDGKLIAVAGDGPVITILDARTGKLILQLKTQAPQVHSVIFTPDGRQLLSGDKDGTIRIWQSETKPAGWVQDVTVFKRPGDRLEALASELAASKRSDEQVVEALYLATLARFPTDSEAPVARKMLAQRKDRAEALRDLLFALTNTKEFNANVEELTKRNPWKALKK